MFFFQAIYAGKMSFTIFQNEKAHFYGIKTRSSKIRKINIFPKGLSRGFGPKMAIFLSFFCQEIQARKMSFTIFQNEKTVFYAIKTRISKVEKLTFSQRVTHGFSPKIAIFLTFFFQAKQARKMSFTTFQIEKKPFLAIETRISKN